MARSRRGLGVGKRGAAKSARRSRNAVVPAKAKADAPAVSGEPFVLGAWGGILYQLPTFIHDDRIADDWADAGLNVAMPPYFAPDKRNIARTLKIMDRAHRRGVRCILGVGGLFSGDLAANGAEKFRKDLRAVLKQLGDHPALYGFYVSDEPSPTGIEAVRLAVQIHNDEAPHLHNFVNHFPAFALRNQAGSDDKANALLDRCIAGTGTRYLSYDCYEQFSILRTEVENLNLYFDSLVTYQRAAARHNIPLWNSGLSMAFAHYRPMTEDDFRWQLNTSIAHGALGLMYFFFCLYDSRENFRLAPLTFGERTAHFDHMRSVHAEFTRHMEATVRGLRLTNVQHYRTAYGGTPGFNGSGRVIKVWAETPLIVSEFTHVNGSNYVMVVNNSPRQITQARFWFRGKHTELFELHRINNTVTEKNVMQMHYECWTPDRGELDGVPFIAVSPNALMPGQMKLYRIVDG